MTAAGVPLATLTRMMIAFARLIMTTGRTASVISRH